MVCAKGCERMLEGVCDRGCVWVYDKVVIMSAARLDRPVGDR